MYLKILLIVQDQAGFVIQPNQAALTKAIRDLLHDRTLYLRFLAGCRRVAKQLSWSRLTEQMEEHYASALATGNSIRT